MLVDYAWPQLQGKRQHNGAALHYAVIVVDVGFSIGQYLHLI